MNFYNPTEKSKAISSFVNKKQTVVALSLLMSTLAFSQKNEIKTAEKAIKSKNFAEAKSAINEAQGLISNADAKTQAKFYFLKGQALYANGAGSSADTDMAIESFNKAYELEDGKGKYSKDIDVIKNNMLSSFLTKANSSLEAKNYTASSKGFEKAYLMSPKDTLYLYYAAATAINGEDYDTALTIYEKLKDMNYTGVEKMFVATNKETNEEEMFDEKNMRDISVKAGTHILPKDKMTDSKSAEIVKNIALIYMNKGQNEKAIAAMKDARRANPDDLNLILSEANLELKMGNKEGFKSLIEEALAKDPNNAELLFNLGIVAAESGDEKSARTYYNRALELKPDYVDVHNNIAVLILGGEQKIIEQMNSLGNSAADNKKYEALLGERLDIYKKAIPHLEATLRLRPTDLQAAKTLMNIYSATDDQAKFKAMKAKVETLEKN